MQVEKESKSVGWEKKDTMNRARWRVGQLERLLLGQIWPPPFTGINLDQNWFDDDTSIKFLHNLLDFLIINFYQNLIHTNIQTKQHSIGDKNI